MSEAQRPKRSKNADFFRASRFLGAHRRLVVVSVLCAFVVGAAFTSTLGTMLPVFNLLLSGQSIQDWANRYVAEKRLGVRIAEEDSTLRLLRVDADGPAAAAGLRQGDTIRQFRVPSSEFRVGATLSQLADASSLSQQVQTDTGRTAVLSLPAVPRYMRLLQRLAGYMPSRPIPAIAAVLGLIAGLTLFGNVVRFFQEYLSDKAAILTVNDIRRKFYDHALHLPLGFFGLKGTSDVTSRLTQDTQVLQEGMKILLGQSIQEPIKAAMALTLAMLLSWKLTLFICLFGPIGVLVIRKFGKKMRRATRQALQNSASMLGQVESSLAGLRVVKASTAERFERRRYRDIMKSLIREQLHMSRIDAMNTPVLETLNLFVVAAVVLCASYLILQAHTLEAGVFMAVMACLVGIGESLRRVGKVNNIVQKCNAAAARIFEILDVPTEREEEHGGTETLRREDSEEARKEGGEEEVRTESEISNLKSEISDSLLRASVPPCSSSPHSQIANRKSQILPPISHSILFESLTFSYPGADQPAVRDVTLRVPKGQSIAIVGRNGSGKTTLLALLPRFYHPQSGRILIDNIDIRTATLSSLRKQIGIVTQESVIFPGTIAHNIAYGLPLATRDEIEAAARRAFAHDFITEKSGGYDCIVGEHGASLSGGQKQRICIARAILRQTPILILDEATSQVDAESEHLIQQAIEGLMHERTTFVIAHRFSTILSADLIVVMERGQIVGQGKHEELLATCGVYQQLYERQLVASPA